MAVSLFEIFKIGIGPSSSHTVGPMRAARQFLSSIDSNGRLAEVESVLIELFGSLAMTGEGHATDIALILGLEGESPESVDTESIEHRIQLIEREGKINLLQKRRIAFERARCILFHKGKRLPYHSNALRLKAFDRAGKELSAQIIYSVGGGFIVDHEQICSTGEDEGKSSIPFPFKTCEELLNHCQLQGKMIYEIMHENEKTWKSPSEIRQGILNIWNVMKDSVQRGIEKEGILPGGLGVRRRASQIYRNLQSSSSRDPSEVFDWVSLYALAVNEENAAGGRIVTAPTNGASGLIPSVLHYYMQFTENPSLDGLVNFFLTAAAIGILYKEGASISAAEMGCQGEIGVACSMAAAGLVAALGGTNAQIENAAEIGMEHHLGLTCDPIAGLVQVPCIERNTMGAIQAINSARLAMHGDGQHLVSLDQVIKTMLQTGLDMKHIYKETSEGGLAVHVSVGIPEC